MSLIAAAKAFIREIPYIGAFFQTSVRPTPATLIQKCTVALLGGALAMRLYYQENELSNKNLVIMMTVMTAGATVAKSAYSCGVELIFHGCRSEAHLPQQPEEGFSLVPTRMPDNDVNGINSRGPALV